MSEGPYELPEGWSWVRLGEVAHRQAVLLRPSDYPSQRFRYLGMEHVAAGQWGEPQPVEVNGEKIKSQVVTFRPGLVLYGKLRPYLNKVVVPRSEGVASTEFVPIAPHDSMLDPEYLGAFLRTRSFVAYAVRNTTGSRQPRTRLDALWNALIPLPPLAEQRRIVARIEELMARVREARRLRGQAREDAERLWQSVLADTFPRPGSDLPPGCRWVRLGETFDVQQGASMSPKRRLGRNPNPFLRTKNVLWGTVDLSSVDEMDFTDEEAEKLRLQPGDLLICEGGDVGRTALWQGELPLVLYQNHIHRLRAKDDSIEPAFVMYWMQTAYQVFLAYQGAESRTAIPNLSGRRLKQFLAPLPPLAEQRRIVTHLEAAQGKIRSLKAAQADTDEELKRLEQSILDKAFRGEL